jgi:hypothetical protein
VELGHAALFGGDERWAEGFVVTSADELAELQGESLEKLHRRPVGPELSRKSCSSGCRLAVARKSNHVA